MSENLSVILLLLFFLIIGIVSFKMYNSKDISNKKIALFISGSLGFVHFFWIMALNLFEEKSIIFGGLFILLFLLVGYPYGVWLLGKLRKL
ncbi:MAG: hypothetical protein JXB38_05830 [Anaerolineales bacterium]|nr:hypothetical protein [Anaerolineales bacterium]